MITIQYLFIILDYFNLILITITIPINLVIIKFKFLCVIN